MKRIKLNAIFVFIAISIISFIFTLNVSKDIHEEYLSYEVYYQSKYEADIANRIISNEEEFILQYQQDKEEYLTITLPKLIQETEFYTNVTKISSGLAILFIVLFIRDKGQFTDNDLRKLNQNKITGISSIFRR